MLKLPAFLRSRFLSTCLLFLIACSDPSNLKITEGPTGLVPSLTGSQFVWPASGWISATDYYGTGQYHELGSADIVSPYWTPVGAARAGTVVEAGWSLRPRFGHYVKLKHDNSYETLYAHFVTSPSVKVGDVVGTNQTLGYSGRTGNAGNPHLHFAILRFGDELKIPELDFGTWVSTGAFIPGDYPDLEAVPARNTTFLVKVIEDRLPVYSSASAASPVRGTLAVNTTWSIKQTSRGYYGISFNGASGYIVSSGVVPTSSKVFGIRTTASVRARSGAGSSYPVKTTFPSGTVLSAFGSKNGYYQTQWRDENNFVQYVWLATSTATETSHFWMRAALAPEVQVRSGPSVSYPVVQTLDFSAYTPEYLVTDNVRGWYKVGAERWLPGWQTIRR